MTRNLGSFLAIMLAFAAAADDRCGPPLSSPPFADDKTFNGVAFNTLIDVWLATDKKPLQFFECPDGGQCLWVPWYAGSGSCETANLKLTECSASLAMNESCLVTDEFSQAGMVLAMGTTAASANAFSAWFNTLQILRGPMTASGPDDPLYSRRLPGWLARLRVAPEGNTITMIQTGDPGRTDDAIDATARVVIALYAAANSSSSQFDARRLEYRIAANELAAAMKQNDFRALTYFGIDHWMGAGWRTVAENADVYNKFTDGHCGMRSFAGYYGDVIIALLAARANTCDSSYEDVATDALENYLYASKWQSAFRVPPMEFAWCDDDATPDGDHFTAVCRQTCATDCNNEIRWDVADAPRAASLCKAAYYWSRLGTIPPRLDSYCESWMAVAGAISPAGDPNPSFVKIYNLAGAKCESDTGVLRGYMNNGLGASLNFFCDRTALEGRLEAIFDLFNGATFPNESCLGIYNQAFAFVNFGSAIGRDLAAFTPRTQPVALADGSPGNVHVSWIPACGATSYEVWRQTETTDFALRTTTTATSIDDTVPSSSAFAYKVRAVFGGGSFSPFSNIDVAYSGAFTDSLVWRQTLIRATHLTELRTAVNAIERALRHSQTTFSAPAPAIGGPILPQHINELRNAIASAFSAVAIQVPAWSQTVSTGTLVRLKDVAELRRAVQ